MNSSKMTQH